jgi:hypothetical protein
MKVIFQYDKEKDIWCILNKGKSSNNSKTATKVYEQLVREYGENSDHAAVASFVDDFISQNKVNIEEIKGRFQKDWDAVSDEYRKRAEKVFGVSLPVDVVAYITINNRCPYNIEENYFYVSTNNFSPVNTAMHELWHFYTWFGLGAEQLERLGAQKYNDLKEALTVLLNVECRDLFVGGAADKGYPQHQELREQILKFWEKDKDIKKLWEYLVNL